MFRPRSQTRSWSHHRSIPHGCQGQDGLLCTCTSRRHLHASPPVRWTGVSVMDTSGAVYFRLVICTVCDHWVVVFVFVRHGLCEWCEVTRRYESVKNSTHDKYWFMTSVYFTEPLPVLTAQLITVLGEPKVIATSVTRRYCAWVMFVATLVRCVTLS